ncbi:hypothetical protein H0H93_013673, partial [Arthromyces matolae]
VTGKTIGLLVVGVALLIAGAVNELFTKRSPIIPPRLFRDVALFSWERPYFDRRRHDRLSHWKIPSDTEDWVCCLGTGDGSYDHAGCYFLNSHWDLGAFSSSRLPRILKPQSQTPLIGLQAAMPLKDMATSTSTFGFIRTIGGTVGVSIGEAIFTNVVSKKMAKIPNIVLDTSPSGLSDS